VAQQTKVLLAVKQLGVQQQDKVAAAEAVQGALVVTELQITAVTVATVLHLQLLVRQYQEPVEAGVLVIFLVLLEQVRTAVVMVVLLA